MKYKRKVLYCSNCEKRRWFFEKKEEVYTCAWCNMKSGGVWGHLDKSMMSIAIATIVMDIVRDSLKKSGLLEENGKKEPKEFKK